MISHAQMRDYVERTIKQQLALATTEEERAAIKDTRETLLAILPQLAGTLNQHLPEELHP